MATEKVYHGETIWARVDKSPGNILAIDNLKDQPDGGWLFGGNDWKRRRLVIDVPPSGTTLQFGFFLKGSGAVWSADFAVAVVDADTALTGKPYESSPRDPSWLQPANLDFSRTVSLTP